MGCLPWMFTIYQLVQDFAGPSPALRSQGAGHGPCIHRDVHGGAKGTTKGGVNVHEESDVPCSARGILSLLPLSWQKMGENLMLMI